MGLDPEFPDYEAGVDCGSCHASLFDNVTPKYVEANVAGGADCPGSPFTFSDGVFLLTQSVNPCLWIGTVAPWAVQWQLRVADSIFSISLPGAFWFFDQILSTCQTSFANSNVCGVGLAEGFGGTAEIFWGPTIDPEP